MAALGRPFCGLPLSGSSDFLQPAPAFPGRAFAPGADGAELSSRPGPRASLTSASRSAARGRCPVRKKRLTEAGLCSGPPDWILCAHQEVEDHGVNACASGLSTSGMFDVLCEEMDQTTAEPQCEVARRRLQEIEDRIIDEDEDEEVEADRSINHLPSLVLSDTMKTGLKREFDEVFTKKMIESMSRPSMELVLWKPLPELLSDKPKPAREAKNYTGERQTKRTAVDTAFPRRTELFLEPRQTGVPLYESAETAASTEEEMEL
ncbi:coiled-coil domain-containing protein 117 isoform 2-T2 [Rhynchocyon petersi]